MCLLFQNKNDELNGGLISITFSAIPKSFKVGTISTILSKDEVVAIIVFVFIIFPGVREF
jgi:hypothetical protein